MNVQYRYIVFALILPLGMTGTALAQQPVERVPTDKSAPAPKDNAKAPPHSDHISAGESSSKQTQIDVSPPPGDKASHPEADLSNPDVNEFTPYNPMKAMKDIEVGDFYFKVKQNYPAAISRYREALEYKPHDADATFKLGQALEKTGDKAGAAENYEAYLKILPNGPFAAKAKEALARLKSENAAAGASGKQ